MVGFKIMDETTLPSSGIDREAFRAWLEDAGAAQLVDAGPAPAAVAA